MAEEIKDISLSSKKSFRIDGDNDRIIYLDVSDMNILVRLEEVYPEIRKLAVEATEKVSNINTSKDSDEDSEDSNGLTDLSKILTDIDKSMREKVNYIFASDICDICVPNGNMFDPVNGEFRFEHLIGVLTTLYANNIEGEFKKIQSRVKKHTAKYTGKRNRK